MQVEIAPAPTPEEREALLRALAQLNGAVDGPDAWWHAGVREAVDDEQDESQAQASARPRRSAGASRA